MKLRLSKIQDTAADRPPGYYEDVVSQGVIDGDFLEIDSGKLNELREKYRPLPPPELPPPAVMAANLARAVADEAKARLHQVPRISDEEVQQRLTVCSGCENFIPSSQRCSLCGCYMQFKSRLRSQSCPVGKW
jgi:hypothetical protein